MLFADLVGLATSTSPLGLSGIDISSNGAIFVCDRNSIWKIGVVAVVEIVGIPLPEPYIIGGLGICGASGNYPVSIDLPGGALGVGFMDIGIGSATYDFATGTFTAGSVEHIKLVL